MMKKLIAILLILLAFIGAAIGGEVYVKDLVELESQPADTDYFPVWDYSGDVYLKILYSNMIPDATTTTEGKSELATDAEAILGTDSGRTLTPSNLKAKLGDQTDGGLLLGSGETAAITAMSVLGDGAIVIGDGATDPASLSAFTSSTGTLKHEYGGIEADISAVDDNYFIVGSGLGAFGIEDAPTALGSIGAAAVDGDILDITYTPTNYTPDATPAEASDVDDLTAHLYGMDLALGGIGASYPIHIESGDTTQVTSVSAIAYLDFDASDFSISVVGNEANVTLPGTVVKSLESDSGSVTPATHRLTVVGGEGIDTTGSGETLTIVAEAASDTNKGVVELATTAETTTGTDTGRAVTPDGLHDMTSLAGAAWFLDEDNMSSDSATKVASQQSIKKYIDDNLAAGYVNAGETPVANDYAKFTDGDTIIGRSYSEVKTDLSLNNVENVAISSYKLDDLAAPDDNTDLDFSTTAHGLVPKGTNVGNYLKDDGTWAAVSSGGVQAWLSAECNQFSTSIFDSYNVASISRTTTGELIVYWDTDFANDDYACVATAGSVTDSIFVAFDHAETAADQKQTDEVRLGIYNDAGSKADTSIDGHICVIAIGDQ